MNAMSSRGAFGDWATQRWVKLTGRRVSLDEYPWLQGPIAGPTGVGRSFFHDLASKEGLTLRESGSPRGLLASLDLLAGPTLNPARIHPTVRAFYEQTSEFELDAWAEWCGAFRPFGRLLPGFYFTVHRSGPRAWARYVRAMTESIRVYPSGAKEVRADHTMWFGGLVFLRLHYRLRPRASVPKEVAYFDR